MILRRIVFGEPRPGMAPFAALLKGLDESVSYCNRTGPLQHDRVTDYPSTIPLFGLGFQQPTPLVFVSAAPEENDPYGIFAWHHMLLYLRGIGDLPVPPYHRRAAFLCDAIYDRPGGSTVGWIARDETAGVAWGAWRALELPGRLYVCFRGSKELINDWLLRDLIGLNVDELVNRLINHGSFGPMWDGFLRGMDAAWAKIEKVVDAENPDELIITGHSLGAAHADVACGYILEGTSK